ncbi:phosphotransferase [Desulfobaculum senezii]
MHGNDIYRDLLSRFGVAYRRTRRDIPLAGSPERCGWRSVVEGDDGRLWVLERLSPGQHVWRESVGTLLSALTRSGCDGAVAYLPCGEGFTCAHGGEHWQLAPFVPGDELPRPDYIHDAERGQALAAFLGRLRRAGQQVTPPREAAPFCLPEYIQDIVHTARRLRPDVADAVEPVVADMAVMGLEFAGAPTALCHGDYHPLNVIWAGQGVRAVIDWEFTGIKPDLYDAANCIGCVGSEHPDYLVRGLVPAFVTGLREEGVLRADNERWLHPLVLGLRMAWLSEWLRRRDEEMLDMELEYMRILTAYAPQIQRGWGIANPA